MHYRKKASLVSILDESPFFTELSIGEREKLLTDLLHTYPSCTSLCMATWK